MIIMTSLHLPITLPIKSKRYQLLSLGAAAISLLPIANNNNNNRNADIHDIHQEGSPVFDHNPFKKRESNKARICRVGALQNTPFNHSSSNVQNFSDPPPAYDEIFKKKRSLLKRGKDQIIKIFNKKKPSDPRDDIDSQSNGEESSQPPPYPSESSQPPPYSSEQPYCLVTILDTNGNRVKVAGSSDHPPTYTENYYRNASSFTKWEYMERDANGCWIKHLCDGHVAYSSKKRWFRLFSDDSFLRGTPGSCWERGYPNGRKMKFSVENGLTKSGGWKKCKSSGNFKSKDGSEEITPSGCWTRISSSGQLEKISSPACYEISETDQQHALIFRGYFPKEYLDKLYVNQ